MDKYDSIIRQYRMVYDHHTHTVWSHGKGTIEDNVQAALARGLDSVAITDHGPGHLTYGINKQKLPEMRAEVETLRARYPGIKILLGVEANTVRRAPFLDAGPEMAGQFDILLAGYHFGIPGAGMVPNYVSSHTGLFLGAGSDLRVKNTAMIVDALYYNEEQGNHIHILTHPGDKGPFDIGALAKACADTATLIEINDKHRHLTVEEIKEASAYDVKFVIGSDAHIPSKVGSFEGPLVRALQAGLDPARIVNIERI